jgi:DNA processing protein
LFERVVARGGALVSRLPDDGAPTRGAFLARNAVLVALSVAVVVVEAGVVSGARSAAASARKLGRPLLVVPHAPWVPSGAGCAAELAAGGAVAVRDVLDVLAALDASPEQLSLLTAPPGPSRARRAAVRRAQEAPLAPRAAPPPAPATPDEAAVLDALDLEPSHVDAVCERSGLSLARAQAATFALTLRAEVVEGPPGFYRRSGRS